MSEDVNWSLQVRRGSDCHDAALQDAVVVFEDAVVDDA